MNTLLVDAGNTRLKWGLLSNGTLGVARAAHYLRGELAAGFAREWRECGASANVPARVLVSNVAGPKVHVALAAWVKEHWAVTIESVVASTSGYGVINAYPHADTLGADRWAGLIAARHHINAAACVVDVGTAITIDVIDREGRHLGGLIAPGIDVMQGSLIRHTDGISSAQSVERNTPENSGIASKNWLGSNTQAGVQNGAVMAATGLVRLALQRAEAMFTGPLHCVFTGGAALAVIAELQAAPVTGVHCCHEPDWVLKGMQIIADGPENPTVQDAAHRPLGTKL